MLIYDPDFAIYEFKSMSENKYWRIEQEMGIYWLKLHRPKKMNSFNATVAEELDIIFSSFLYNKEIRVLIITTDFNDFFSAGADIDWFQSINGSQAQEISKKSHEIFRMLERMPFPTIAAIKGLCLTAGLELVLCCDMIYGAENAKFGQIETVFGITPGGGGTQRLTRLIGPNRAKEMIFSARVIGASEADKIGLINAEFPLNGFDEKIARIARNMLLNSKQAIARCKFLVEKAFYTNDEGFRAEEIAFNESFSSGEPRDRLRHFKRQQERKQRRKNQKEKRRKRQQNAQ
jgi:enoyl-CoA hydratase